MVKRKLKDNGRRKAPFGSQEAAILTSAAINAAAQLTAAGINSSATKDAAQKQAQAISNQAIKQADALRDQNVSANEMQQKSQEFINEQNAENRELQKDIQMQLQMLVGQQNVNDRLEASKIKVKNGGSTRRKLRLVGTSQFPLRGSNNIPFIVTDGGNVIPIGRTAEGYDMYEIVGNDHEHYHKAQGGKNKTGVGIKFADGNVIEGEGNQNTNQGEIMVNTPTNAYFISKHSIAGFNPAKMTLNGMHPLQAYAIQEQLKAANGISDDGKHNSSPVEKKLLGGEQGFVFDMYNKVGPQMGVDTVGDTSVGVAAVKQNENKLKFGGNKRYIRLGGRRKADKGTSTWVWGKGWVPSDEAATNPYSSNISIASSSVRNGNNNNTTRPVANNTTGEVTRSYGSSFWNGADLAGAGIGALGNIGGAWITSSANRAAANTIANAQNQAAGIMRDAYNSLTGVDMNSIRREDFSAAHVMPALQAPVSFASSQIAGIDRKLQRRLSNAGRYSASSAAAQERMANAEIEAQDDKNRVYSADQQQMQVIRQGNAERATQAAVKNAELDMQANRDYTSAYLDLLQYNNDINNQKILGAAGAISEGAINSANTMSAAQTSNAQAWANALLGGTQGFTSSLSAMADRKAKLASALLGAGSDSQASYYATIASRGEAQQEYNALIAQYNATKDEDTKKRLARQINNIASKRGFKLV